MANAATAGIEAASAEGKALLLQGKYGEAVAKLGEAIEGAERRPRRPRHLGGRRDEEELLLLLSNRSAAHRGSGDYSSAIADAKRCVELDRENYRGYWRLGVALRCNGQWVAAARALGEGISAVGEGPGADKLRNELAETERLEEESKRAPPPPPPPTAAPPGAPGDLRARGVISGTRALSLLVLRLFVLFNTVIFAAFNIVGPAPAALGAWRMVLLGSALSHCAHVCIVLGWPSRGTAYAAQLFSREEFTRIVMCPVLLAAYPAAPALIPVVAMEPIRISDQLSYSCPPLQRLATLCVAPTAKLIFGDADARIAEGKLHRWIPYLEIAVAFLLTLQLVTPQPSPFACFGYWMLLQVRHMVEAASDRLAPPSNRAAQVRDVRDAWDSLDRRAEALFGALPVLGGAYRLLRKFLHRQVHLPDKGQKPAVRCAVM